MPKINPVEILTFLAECFPQTFVVERHQPHRPLKIGIDVDLAERCPAIDRFERLAVLRYYCTRPMYLRVCIEGAVCVDLDGNPAGVVAAAEAEFAAATLVEVLAKREARRAVKKPATVPAPSTSKPSPASASTPLSTSTSTATPTKCPLLRLPAFSGGAR